MRKVSKLEIVKVSKSHKKIVFIEMSTKEALETIKSLASQLATGDPNTGRYEEYAKDGTYFSIAVVDQKGRLTER